MEIVVLKCERCGKFLISNAKFKKRRCSTCNRNNDVLKQQVATFSKQREALEWISARIKRASQSGFHIEGVRIIKKRCSSNHDENTTGHGIKLGMTSSNDRHWRKKSKIKNKNQKLDFFLKEK
ncbi:MAG: hypothetical protein ACTSRA_04050 [Promethearchaeota archaeon]